MDTSFESSMTITILSSRIYLDELPLDETTLQSLANTFVRFNVMTEFAYNRLYDKTFLKKEFPGTLTRLIKDEYQDRFNGKIDDYYCASVQIRAGSLLSSQKQLQRRLNREFEERQTNRRLKVQDIKDELSRKQNLKALFVERSKAKKAGLPFDDSRFNEYKISATCSPLKRWRIGLIY